MALARVSQTCSFARQHDAPCPTTLKQRDSDVPPLANPLEHLLLVPTPPKLVLTRRLLNVLGNIRRQQARARAGALKRVHPHMYLAVEGLRKIRPVAISKRA